MPETFVSLAKIICLWLLPENNNVCEVTFLPLTLYPDRYKGQNATVTKEGYPVVQSETKDSSWVRIAKALRIRRMDMSRWLADTFESRKGSKVMRNYILLESFNRLDKKILELDQLGKLVANKALSVCLRQTQNINKFALLTGVSEVSEASEVSEEYDLKNATWATNFGKYLIKECTFTAQETFSHVLDDITQLGNTRTVAENTVDFLYDKSSTDESSSSSSFDFIE
jgi:hypothetical protein